MLKAYVKMIGTKQGPFPGEETRARWAGWIPVLGIDYTDVAPRDVASGQGAGKRQHGTVQIVKALGAASSQLFLAAVAKEVLSSVAIRFVRTSAHGEEVVYHTIRLTNVTVRQARRTVPSRILGIPKETPLEEIVLDVGETRRPGPRPNPHELDRVRLTFQQITVLWKDGKTTSGDSWDSQG
jgi:type VI secretion system Hcp family effector